jgi:hypothetical protein
MSEREGNGRGTRQQHTEAWVACNTPPRTKMREQEGNKRGTRQNVTEASWVGAFNTPQS